MIINIALAVLAIIVAYTFIELLTVISLLEHHYHSIQLLDKETKRLNEQISRFGK